MLPFPLIPVAELHCLLSVPLTQWVICSYFRTRTVIFAVLSAWMLLIWLFYFFWIYCFLPYIFLAKLKSASSGITSVTTLLKRRSCLLPFTLSCDLVYFLYTAGHSLRSSCLLLSLVFFCCHLLLECMPMAGTLAFMLSCISSIYKSTWHALTY